MRRLDITAAPLTALGAATAALAACAAQLVDPGTLLELTRTLRHPQLYDARGIAMLELVLSDGTGPAHTDPTGEG